MRLAGHTSGQYKGRSISLVSAKSPPLDYAFLEIRQTWEMLNLIKHADKGLYDRCGFDAISKTLEDMLPDFRDATNNVIANAQKLLEQSDSRGAVARTQRMAQIAAARDHVLVESYLLVMQDVSGRLNQAIGALSAGDMGHVKSPPGADKDHTFDWPHSATVHAHAAVNLLQKEVDTRARASEGPQAAAL